MRTRERAIEKPRSACVGARGKKRKVSRSPCSHHGLYVLVTVIFPVVYLIPAIITILVVVAILLAPELDL
jgi:hypothetical protein